MTKLNNSFVPTMMYSSKNRIIIITNPFNGHSTIAIDVTR